MANELTWAADPPCSMSSAGGSSASLELDEGWGLGCEAADPALLGLIDSLAAELPAPAVKA